MTERPNTAYLQTLQQALLPAIYNAGSIIMAIHKKQISSRLKPDGSPVSEADEAAEAILLPALGQAAPNITIISEEKMRRLIISRRQNYFSGRSP